MYQGQFPAASNRADWCEVCTLIDADTNDVIDITGCTITLTVRTRGYTGQNDGYDDSSGSYPSAQNVLQGSTTTGEITIVDIGSFQLLFTADKMSSLCEKTYDVGVRIAQSGRTVQLMIGQLPILEGIDAQ